MPPIAAGASAAVTSVLCSCKACSLAASIMKGLGSVPMVVVVMWLGA